MQAAPKANVAKPRQTPKRKATAEELNPKQTKKKKSLTKVPESSSDNEPEPSTDESGSTPKEGAAADVAGSEDDEKELGKLQNITTYHYLPMQRSFPGNGSQSYTRFMSQYHLLNTSIGVNVMCLSVVVVAANSYVDVIWTQKVTGHQLEICQNMQNLAGERHMT